MNHAFGVADAAFHEHARSKVLVWQSFVLVSGQLSAKHREAHSMVVEDVRMMRGRFPKPVTFSTEHTDDRIMRA
ncbi:hypothetical protein [Cognatishimia activa]|uniref:Uncharacterized protein n=1 Tax=Cognatishimia activa TaxID=1715691 RepID=A0A975EMS8_9RHOB|nr:hypothetical protein [Cognatishimia activa]QTN35042.1 hypothetical protein HZ995_11160 [Cognatishimia activa]